jgi:hypothetical protein
MSRSWLVSFLKLHLKREQVVGMRRDLWFLVQVHMVALQVQVNDFVRLDVSLEKQASVKLFGKNLDLKQISPFLKSIFREKKRENQSLPDTLAPRHFEAASTHPIHKGLRSHQVLLVPSAPGLILSAAYVSEHRHV